MIWLGFHKIRGTYGFSFLINKKRYTPFVQFSLVDKWWIPHFEIWSKGSHNTYICGWIFFYFGYMVDKKNQFEGVMGYEGIGSKK